MRDSTFKLSSAGYYADVIAAPCLGIVLVFYGLAHGGSARGTVVLLVAGVLLWTLAEYLIHRFLFHGSLWRLHRLHHEAPAELIGVPWWSTWMGAGILALLACYAGAPASACPLFGGVLLGYGYYLAIHDACHHGAAPQGIARHHRGHHDAGPAAPPRGCNFGVSFTLWDRIFLTRRP